MDIINWVEFLQPYEQCAEELKVKFKGIENSFRIKGQHSPIESVEVRVKKIGSILDKAKKKNISYFNIEKEVEDIAGIRIICKFVEDIQIVVEEVRKRVGYDLEIVSERDYITNPKESGYKSYHIIVAYNLFTIEGIKPVRAEIQIRTLAMNFWATIEHSLNYKYNNNLPDEVRKRLISSAQVSSQLDNEMSDIREEILETLEISRMKNILVEEILGRIGTLYFKQKIENANELNEQFFKLYESGTIDELVKFNERVKLISRLHEES